MRYSGKKATLYLALATLIVSACATGVRSLDSVNRCNDAQAEQEWTDARAKRNNPQFDQLYALRQNLCTQLAEGKINPPVASEEYQAGRRAYFNHWGKKQREEFIEFIVEESKKRPYGGGPAM